MSFDGFVTHSFFDNGQAYLPSWIASLHFHLYFAYYPASSSAVNIGLYKFQLEDSYLCKHMNNFNAIMKS